MHRAPDRRSLAAGLAIAIALLAAEITHGVEERRFDTREREVEPVQARDGEREGVGIALPRQPVDLASAGIAEAEQAEAG